MYTLYLVRGEWSGDIQALINTVPKEHVAAASIESRMPFPDVETGAIVAIGLSLEDMRSYCRQIPDGHVMLQTIQPADRYTGERDYSLS